MTDRRAGRSCRVASLDVEIGPTLVLVRGMIYFQEVMPYTRP